MPTAPENQGKLITLPEVNLDSAPEILAPFQAVLDDFRLLKTDAEKTAWLQHNRVTLSDKHGNTLRLIYELVLLGVLDVKSDNVNIKDCDITDNDLERSPENKYSELAAIYNTHQEKLDILSSSETTELEKNTAKEAIKEDFDQFKKILDSCPINCHLFIRQLGDLFSDRGVQDYFSLLVFDQLQRAGVSYEIIYSNHDDQLMRKYEEGFLQVLEHKQKLGGYFSSNTDRSLQNLGIVIQQGIVESSVVNTLIETAVKPYLQIAACDHVVIEEKPGVLLYSHAPIDFLQIENFLKHLNKKYKFSAETIRHINSAVAQLREKFRTEIVKKNRCCELQIPSEILKTMFLQEIEAIFDEYPLRGFIWGRPNTVVNTLEMLQENKSALEEDEFLPLPGARTKLYLPSIATAAYPVRFVFGHMGEEATVKDINGELDARYINTETNLGKSSRQSDQLSDQSENFSLKLFYCGNHEAILNLAVVAPSAPEKQQQQLNKTTPSIKSIKPKYIPIESLLKNPEKEDRGTVGCVLGCGGLFSSRRVNTDPAEPRYKIKKTKKDASFCPIL